MKRAYFYIVGGIIILGLVGFWVYSFLYGSPTNDGTIFTNLGIFGQNNAEEIYTPPVSDEVPTVDVTTEKLRQLTTKPVIGARIITKAEGLAMRYVEAGTGHVFDINLVSGQEERVSQISVPSAEKAIVSSNGSYVAVRSGLGNEGLVTLVNLSDPANPSSVKLPNRMRTFAFGYNNELLFTETALGQTEGKGYLPSTAVTRRLFTAPLAAHAMAWSESSTTNHIIYTKPASTLLGYAYEVAASGLKRYPYSGLGLTITQSGGVRFVGRNINGSYRAVIINPSGQGSESPAALIPEKCISGNAGQYCASPFELTERDFPDTWYKGQFVSNDNIWKIEGGNATLIAFPSRTIGRNLDITELRLSQNDEMLYFVNRIDNTLWLYEI